MSFQKYPDITTFEQAEDRIEILENQMDDLKTILCDLISILNKDIDFNKIERELRNL